MGIILSPNEAPRRKRAGYQNGIESDLYLGENAVSPQLLFRKFTPPQTDGGLKTIIKHHPYPFILATSPVKKQPSFMAWAVSSGFESKSMCKF
jgi:hypothetical protein